METNKLLYSSNPEIRKLKKAAVKICRIFLNNESTRGLREPLSNIIEFLGSPAESMISGDNPTCPISKWSSFNTAYSNACCSKSPQDWQKAAELAEEIRLALYTNSNPER